MLEVDSAVDKRRLSSQPHIKLPLGCSHLSTCDRAVAAAKGHALPVALCEMLDLHESPDHQALHGCRYKRHWCRCRQGRRWLLRWLRWLR